MKICFNKMAIKVFILEVVKIYNREFIIIKML